MTWLVSVFEKSLPLAERIMLPPEIKKLGKEAEEIYLHALDEGEQKIPYCGLLILGRQQVGKTSLYRQLVGKVFKDDLESTQGIDNNTVDTVDRRNIDIEKEVWQEVGPDAGEGDQFGEAVLNEVVDKLPRKSEETPDVVETVGEEELFERIRNIQQQIQDIIREREESAAFIPFVAPELSESEPPPAKSSRLDPSPLRLFPPQQPLVAEEKVEIVVEKPPPPPPDPTPPPPQPPAPAATPAPVQPQPQDKPRPKPRHYKPKHQGHPNSAESAPPPPRQPVGMLNRRQSSRIGAIVKNKEKFEKKDLPLVLNALDFTGQKKYRPMHHCFIARRAIYLVVFKIPDLLTDEKTAMKAIDEVRYWIHSIHAHIYPPDQTVKGEDEKVQRVFLVGTHRGKEPLSKDDANKINDLIADLDDRCVNHICPVAGSYFIPVENSIDARSSGDYLNESGTKPLQDAIKEMSKDPKMLPFLHEVHPIKWLKFEEELKDLGKSMKVPVVRLEKVLEIAQDCKISDKQVQDLALKFFHHSGKIICLSE